MPQMKTFPRPTESNDREKKSEHRGRLLLMFSQLQQPQMATNQLPFVKYFAQASTAP
jgi:hypothetical protein